MVASNDLNISQAGYVVFDGTATFTGRTFQAGTGVTLTNASGVGGNTTIAVSGSSVGQTITGDTGGALSPTAGNWNILSKATAGFSTSFSGSGSTLSFNTTDAFLNTLIGQLAGNASLATAGAANTGLGYSILHALTTGVENTALGYSTLTSLQSGSRNVAVGHGVLSSGAATAITDNVGVGYKAAQGVTTGIQNTLVGSLSGNSITTGRNNICLGYNSATACTSSESSNILIGNIGVAAESNVIRIGTQGSGTGQQNQCFIAGITGVTTSNSQMVTVDTTTGKLGAATIPSGTVTTVSVVSTNGFAGTVANATTTPAITLTTTATGVLSGNGTAISGSAITQYDVLVGGASNAISSVGTGSVGQVLQSGGNAANPAYSTATYPSTAGTSGNVLTSDGTNWVSSAASGGGIQSVTGTMTSAQIKAAHGTPFQVIAAPGAGKTIQVVSSILKYVYGGTNVFIAATGQTITLIYGTTTSLSTLPTSTSLSNAILTGTTNAVCLGQSVVLSSSAVINQPINLYNSMVTEITGNLGNDNTIQYYLTYIIF